MFTGSRVQYAQRLGTENKSGIIAGLPATRRHFRAKPHPSEADEDAYDEELQKLYDLVEPLNDVLIHG